MLWGWRAQVHGVGALSYVGYALSWTNLSFPASLVHIVLLP